MPIETWFPLAIYIDDLPDAQTHKKALLDAIRDLKARSLPPRNYPEMAWTGDLHGVERIHLDPRFDWIIRQVETHSLSYLTALGIDLSKVELYIQRGWPIISQPGQEVAPHCHHTAHLSAVYYVSVPNSGSDEAGCLILIDDARRNEISPGLGSENTEITTHLNEFNQDNAVYFPTEGRLLIFPAKQRHAVSMNETEGDRISLSFDIILTATQGQAAGSYEFLTPPPSQWQRFRPSPTQPS